MTIHWLNDDCTCAHITVGWFRKRFAVVQRKMVDAYTGYGSYKTPRWHHQTTDRDCGIFHRIEWARDKELRRREEEAKAPKEWQPVRSLPHARLVRGE